MIEEEPEQETANLTFLHGLARTSYLGGIESVTGTLTAAPLRIDSPQLLKLREWYAGLSKSDADMVQDIIRMSSSSALFHALVYIDGYAEELEYPTSPDSWVDIELSLMVYECEEDHLERRGARVISLNPSVPPHFELHSEWLGMEQEYGMFPLTDWTRANRKDTSR